VNLPAIVKKDEKGKFKKEEGPDVDEEMMIYYVSSLFLLDHFDR
jgi:hypothetical protein